MAGPAEFTGAEFTGAEFKGAEFKGKAALVTGGSAGIGLHVAEQLAEAG
jgi:hypothetical protein